MFGSYNRGDALLVEALHDSLRQTFGEGSRLDGIAHFPELERVHLPEVCWHRPPGRSYLTSPTLRRLQNAARVLVVATYAVLGAPRWFPPLAPREQLSAVRAIRDSDLVVSCAGGFLIDTNLSILGNLMQLATAIRFRKAIVIAPQTIGPIRRSWIRPLLRWVLNRCGIICTREPYSYNYVIKLGVDDSKVRQLTDLALYHRRVDSEAGSQALHELGISSDERFLAASVVNWSFPRSSDARASRERYFESFCWIVSEVHRRFGYRTLLVNQVSADLPFARRVKEKLGELVVLDERDRTPAEMRGLIRSASAFFGSRFHSCVFALLERVPTVSLAYSYKSTGIMETLGLGEYVFDIDGFDKPTVLARIVSNLEEGEQMRRRIDATMSNLSFPTFASVLAEYAIEPTSGSSGPSSLTKLSLQQQ
ncbi:polysaccharide pyruvyl transferase family protein [Marinivivus vitaminiproducens]|uniref:polysaccharide pyruvyl transferase family protein n=1 Tax=Marinivivus vitaminiproducens TaxID=3035935 RepID=UPI0027992B1E|nr:polysaccharide pyruvyl transferase family protein [Geminicoccaceae bacterium SCSIO 64248]